MRYQQSLLLLAFLGLELAACKKDKEGTPPSSHHCLAPAKPPPGGARYLLVTVTVSDDERVEQVSGLPAGRELYSGDRSGQRHALGSPGTLNLALPVTSERLESGTVQNSRHGHDGELYGEGHTTQLKVAAVPSIARVLRRDHANGQHGGALSGRQHSAVTSMAGTFDMDLGGAAISFGRATPLHRWQHHGAFARAYGQRPR